jgi:hypothetical protein
MATPTALKTELREPRHTVCGWPAVSRITVSRSTFRYF